MKLIETIVSIVVILLLILIIGNFLGVNLWTLAKSALSFGKDIVPIDYTQLNNQAKMTFEKTIEDIENCKDFKDTNCKCSVDLSGYSQTHALFFENEKIKLLNIKNIEGNIIKKVKEGEGVVIDSSTIGNINCFFKKLNPIKKEDFDIIYFYQDKGPIIFKETFYTSLTSLGAGHEILENYQLYKSNIGEICWLTIKVNKNDLNNIKECNTETFK